MRKQSKRVRAVKASDLSGNDENNSNASKAENDKGQTDDILNDLTNEVAEEHDDEVEDHDSTDKTGFFDTIITDGKRARSNPQAEKTLRDWLTQHFVCKDGSYLSTDGMYSAYLESCSSLLTFGVNKSIFLKIVSELYQKGMSLVETSPYVGLIREKKPKKTRTERTEATQKSDPAKIVASEIKEAILRHGNPRKGIHYQSLRRSIEERLPALVKNLPKLVKRTLLREVYHGRVECVRGIGACGVYRLPRTPEEEQEQLKEEKRIKKEKYNKETEETQKDDLEEAKNQNGQANSTESSNQETEEQSKDTNRTVVAEKQKLKKKTKKQPKAKDSALYHGGQPKHVSDVFPLAMTYNNEPKQASARKIFKYISEHYDSNVDFKKVKKCLESGLNKGYWELIGSSTSSSTYCLAVEAFDPTADDDLIGKIMNAIVACSEPKVSSAGLLKQYLIDYHPEFKVQDKVNLFKSALEKAVTKQIIIRVSGLGSCGSFKLTKAFTPSPAMLQGKDVEAIDTNEDEYVPRPTKRRGRKVALVIDRFDPSKEERDILNTGSRKKVDRSREKSRMKKGITNHESGVRKRCQLASSARVSHRKKSKLTTDCSDDEESEDNEQEEYIPKKSFSRGGAKQHNVVKKRGRPKLTSKVSHHKDAEKSDDSEQEEYTPKKSVSRGGAKQHNVVKKRGRPKLTSKVSHHKDAEETVSRDTEESDDSEQEEYTPRESLSRGEKKEVEVKTRGRPASIAKLSHKKKNTVTNVNNDIEESEDIEQEEYTPRRSLSRGGTEQQNVVKKRGRPVATSKTSHQNNTVSAVSISSKESDDSEQEEYTPKKSLSRGGKQQVKVEKRGRPSSIAKLSHQKNVTNDVEESDDSEQEQFTPKKVLSRSGKKQVDAKKRGRSSSIAKVSPQKKRAISHTGDSEESDNSDRNPLKKIVAIHLSKVDQR